MDNLTLITGFKQFLRELAETSDKQYDTDCSSSIFQYSDEFKQFLHETLNIDTTSIFSKNIGDIMDMEVVDGQLVDEAEYQRYLKSQRTGEPYTSQTEDEEISDDFFGDLTVDILNVFLQDESVIDYLDKDGSGELNKSEIQTFLTRIKGLDNDRTNISLDDVMEGINTVVEEIKNERFQEFRYGSSDSMTREERRAAASAEIESRASQRSSRSERLAAGGRTTETNSVSTTSYTTSYDLAEKSLSNMTKEELEQELAAAKTTLSEKQTKYNEIENGTDSEIKAKKENVDNLYEIYQEKVETCDKDLKDKLEQANSAVEEQKNVLAQKEIEISQQEVLITNLETSYQTAYANRSSLEIQLSELQTSLSGAEDDEKSAIESKISGLKAKIEEAKAKENEIKSELERAQEQLDILNQEKNQQEMVVAQKEEVKIGIENKIQEKYPELQEYLDSYNTAKNDYEAVKETMLFDARCELQDAQKEVDKIETALATVETRETLREYSIGGFSEYNEEKGMGLVNAALELHGNNHTSGKQCGKGVGESIEAAFGYRLYGDGYEWADNLANRSDWQEVTEEVSVDELTSLPAGAVVSWSQYDGGPYGHVFISDGQGHEISDFTGNISVDKYLNAGATYRVFVPV